MKDIKCCAQHGDECFFFEVDGCEPKWLVPLGRFLLELLECALVLSWSSLV